MHSVKGQTAIITGASRGIGRAIAIKLGEAGMNLVLTARGEGALQETASLVPGEPDSVLAIPADVTDKNDVKRVFESAIDRFGSVDLLVNNAGSLAAIGPTWEADAADWLQDITVNLQGVFLCCRAALQIMLLADKGRIINMSGGGAGGPFPFASAYATSKAGVVRLTENIAAEMAETYPASNVRIFSMSPSFVRTAMTEQFTETEDGRKWMHRLSARLDQGQSAPPDYAAELVLELATGELDFLHGRFIHAEQDRDQWDEMKSNADEIRMSPKRLLRFVK